METKIKILIVVLILLVSIFSKSVVYSADDWESFMSTGIRLMDENKDYKKAEEAFTKALEIDGKRAEALVRRGMCRYEQGKFEEAAFDYTSAYVLDPKNMVPLYYRAFAFDMQGMYYRALFDIQNILVAQPGNSYALGLRGWIYIKMGKYREALLDIEKAYADLLPMQKYDFMGWAYFFSGRLKQARREALSSLAIDPDDVVGRALLYRVEVELGEGEKALRSMKDYLAGPKNKKIDERSIAILYYFVGDISLEELARNPWYEDFKVALQPLGKPGPIVQTSTQNKPSDFDYSPQLEKADKLVKAGKLSKARELLVRTVDEMNEEDILVPPYVEEFVLYLYMENTRKTPFLFSAAIVQQLGGLQEAQAGFLNTLYPLTFYKEIEYTWNIIKLIEPQIPYLYYRLSEILVREREYASALTHLDNAIRAWPAFKKAYVRKVYVCMEMKDLQGAKEMASQALKVLGESETEERARLDCYLGRIAVEEGEFERAKDYFRHCLELEPTDRDAADGLRNVESVLERQRASGG